MDEVTFFLYRFVLIGFVVVMFAMNLAVVLTWADRRQGAMIQDRVGPNRAVAWLPRPVAQALLMGPALAVAALILYSVLSSEVTGSERAGRAMLLSQAAILVTWVTGLAIAARVRARGARNSFDRFISTLGDPRRFVYAGFSLHGVAFLLTTTLRGTELGETLTEIGYGSGTAILVFSILFGAGYAVYSLHKQKRVGLRLFGLLHPAADGLKTLFKEDFIPPGADRLLHSIAPFISFFPVLVVLAVVPFGDTLCFSTGKDGAVDPFKLIETVPREGVCVEGALKLQAVDINVGILFFFALAGTGIVGAALAGWASNNKYSLLGGLRAASQMVSYEVTLGLTVIGALMVFSTVRVDEMVRWQAEHAWGVFVQPLGFVLFFAAAVAESKRIPFDLPEGESEIVAGYFTEYSGMKFAMFFFSEYVAVVTSSALMVALFFGGWHIPFLERDGLFVAFGGRELVYQPLSHGLVVALGVLAFIVKTIALCWLQLTIRWTLPRFRYDQLMKLGWRKLLPASLVNILVTGLVLLALQAPDRVAGQVLTSLGELSEWLIALLLAGGLVYGVAFLVAPPKKRRTLSSSSAQFADAAGGTRTARMGA